MFVPGGSWSNYGMGPFVAGYSSASYLVANNLWVSASTVMWSDLNTDNACQPGSAIYLYWSQPNGLCPASSGGTPQFALPSQVQGIQACMVLATIFAFFTCASGFSVSASRGAGGYAGGACSLLATIFCIASFAIWTTWPLSTSIQSAPGYVPVWTAGGALYPSQPVVLGYGGTYVTTVISFVCLLFSTVSLFSISHRLDDEPAAGAFGAGI